MQYLPPGERVKLFILLKYRSSTRAETGRSKIVESKNADAMLPQRQKVL
jgi:hypothetical protein